MIPNFDISVMLRVIVIILSLFIFYRFVYKNIVDEWTSGQLDMMLLLQTALAAALIVAAPFTHFHIPYLIYLGFLVFILGTVLIVGGYKDLGISFTGSVTPKEEGQLVTSGFYDKVRHPMYGGGILFFLGWSLFWGTWLGLILSIVAFVFFDLKANKEEELLLRKYPGYQEYKARVPKKLIPYVY